MSDSPFDLFCSSWDVIRTDRISSVAVPLLGCGKGDLDWRIVGKFIE